MTLCNRCQHGEICNIRDGHDEADERALVQCAAFIEMKPKVEIPGSCKKCTHCEFFKQDIDYKAMVTHIVDVDDRTLFTTYIALKNEISLLSSYAKAMSSELLRREP